MRNCKITAPIIYDRNKGDVEISALIKNIGAQAMRPSKYRRPNYAPIKIFFLSDLFQNQVPNRIIIKHD